MAISIIKLFVSLALALPLLLCSVEAQLGLKVGFYQKTCPQAEAIIRAEINRVMSIAPSLAAPLLRMHFHDCFVNGCDGSILLNSTSKSTAEKDAFPNVSIRGYGVIDGIKAKLEKACPQTVSCADIVAVVARDVVVSSKGPSWQVPTGRRDSTTSTFTALPSLFDNFTTLRNDFFSKGLTVKDLVVLSGAHTIGTAHCLSVTVRLYNFTGKGDADPALNRKYATKLRLKCKNVFDLSRLEMDPGSFRTFDTGYYKGVAKGKGLFVSDNTLLSNAEARAYIMRQAAATNPSEFFTDFAASMVKMGNIGVLIGSQGEIRKRCSFTN